MEVARKLAAGTDWEEHGAALCQAESYDDLRVGPEAGLSRSRQALECAVQLGAGPEAFDRLARAETAATRAYARVGLSRADGWTAQLLEEALGDTQPLSTRVGCRSHVVLGRDVAYEALASSIAPEHGWAMLVTIALRGTELPSRTLRDAMRLVTVSGSFNVVDIADLPTGGRAADALRAGADAGSRGAATPFAHGQMPRSSTLAPPVSCTRLP